MLRIITSYRKIIPLFIGLMLIMIAQGIQSAILPAKASAIGFDKSSTGYIMSFIYVGLMIGALTIGKFLSQIGYVRTFAGFTSINSAIIILYPLFENEFIWAFIRTLSGISYAAIIVITETWLSQQTEQKDRGIVLSLYMLICYIGISIGSYFSGYANIEQFDFFAIMTILISLGAVPLLFSARDRKSKSKSIKFNPIELFNTTPIAVIGMLVTGILNGFLIGLPSVYIATQGLSIEHISKFVTYGSIGCIGLLYIAGYISDRIDRRVVILFASIFGGITAYIANNLSITNFELLCILFAVMNAFLTPLYSLIIAHVNDIVHDNKRVASISMLSFLFSSGAIIGSLSGSFIIGSIDPNKYFLSIAYICLAFSLYTIIRLIKVQRYIDIEDKAKFMPLRSNVSSSPEILDENYKENKNK